MLAPHIGRLLPPSFNVCREAWLSPQRAAGLHLHVQRPSDPAARESQGSGMLSATAKELADPLFVF